MITEDYISFKIAKFLKEKGFDENCAALYDLRTEEISQQGVGYVFNNNQWENFITAPTLQMAAKWLRKIHHIQIEILIIGEEDKEFYAATKWVYGWRIQSPKFIDRHQCTFTSYEKACESAIQYSLEVLI